MADAYRWEQGYERSWEQLNEDEQGFLQVAEERADHRKRFFHAELDRLQSVCRRIIRYGVILLDHSESGSQIDYKPNRMIFTMRHVEHYIREFMDQNPLSRLALVVMHDRVAEVVSQLAGNAETHIENIKVHRTCSGDPSLQNGLETARTILATAPSFAAKEILVVYSSLRTCDPGNIHRTIGHLRDEHIRCSVISLDAEVHILRQLARTTDGRHGVALDEPHFRELLTHHAFPPSTLQYETGVHRDALIRMGFPKRCSENRSSLCACHNELRRGGYECPRCQSKCCTVPMDCPTCGLTLASAAHLARSYHHLFPVPPFREVNESEWDTGPSHCCGCLAPFPARPTGRRAHTQIRQAAMHRMQCPKCHGVFCTACDTLIHESLHNCPCCEAQSQSTIPPSSEYESDSESACLSHEGQASPEVDIDPG